jgi:hypothetical protein
MRLEEYEDAIRRGEKVREEWRTDCIHYWGRTLTGKKGHWCPEWDYLPIDDTCQEFEHCLCFDDVNNLDSMEN